MSLLSRVRLHMKSGLPARLIARSAAGMLVALLSGMALNLAANAVLARSMGVEQYGIYAYVFSWLTLLVLPARLGFDRTANRFVAAYKALEQWPLLRGVLRYAVALTLLGSLTVGGGLLLLTPALSGPDRGALATTFYIAAAALPLWAFLSLGQGFIRALKRPVLAELPERILLPSSLLLLVAAYAAFAGAAPDAVAAMATAGIVGLVGCLLCGAMILRLLPDPARRAKAEYRPREWLRVSLPMLVISGSSVLYRRLDVIMVGLLLGPAAAGIMAVAVRLANLVSLGLAATNPMVSTIVAENHATGRLDRLQTSLRFASLLTVALTAGIAAPLILLGDDLLGVFGEQFRTAYVALVILTAGQIVNALTGSVNAVLTMTGHQDRVAIIMLASAALNALLNIPLVLHYGVLGGAIASAVAVTLKNLAMLVAARRQLGIDPSIAAAFSGRRKLAVG